MNISEQGMHSTGKFDIFMKLYNFSTNITERYAENLTEFQNLSFSTNFIEICSF